MPPPDANVGNMDIRQARGRLDALPAGAVDGGSLQHGPPPPPPRERHAARATLCWSSARPPPPQRCILCPGDAEVSACRGGRRIAERAAHRQPPGGQGAAARVSPPLQRPTTSIPRPAAYRYLIDSPSGARAPPRAAYHRLLGGASPKISDDRRRAAWIVSAVLPDSIFL